MFDNFRNGSFFKFVVDSFTGLDGIEDRANHTGTQLASTISDFSTAADARISAARGANNGVAPLDSGGKVPSANLPSYVDDVLEYVNLAAFPGTGDTGKIYVDLATGKIHRWSGSAYVEISASPGSTDSVTEGSTNLYFTEARVRSTALTGLSATDSAVTSSDSVLAAVGKLQGQLNTLKDWKTAVGIKRTASFNLTSDSSGDVAITFGFTASNANKIRILVNGIYNSTDHPFISGVRSLSTTAATVRVYRAISMLVLGTTVTPLQNKDVTVTVIELE